MKEPGLQLDALTFTVRKCTSWKTHTPSPKTGLISGTEHFLFVLLAEGEKMQWGWNAGGFFVISVSKYLFEKEVTHWIMRSLSVRSVWPGQSLHFSPKMCICLRNVLLDSSSSLNKDNRKTEANIKWHQTSLKSIILEVWSTCGQTQGDGLIKYSTSWKQILIRQSSLNFNIVLGPDLRI